MINFEKEFENLICIKKESTLLSGEEMVSKKKKQLKDKFDLLNDDLKLSFINILKNNTVTNHIKDNLTEKEIELLNRNKFLLRKDFISLSVILNCLLKFNLEDKVK